MSLGKQILDSIKFKIGDTVYLITDEDQKKRIITGILIRMSGVQYELSQGTASAWHYVFEVTDTVDIKSKTEN